MYIEKIKSPADLKKLDLKELQVVADETRQAVLNRVSKHGGHVGPNLGFVEATVALHYVFDAPKDKFVFDVSHQCYPHKVLTGRAAGFLGDVDDMNAISGYSSPAECPEYDNFEVGHTSTSVSLATGLQKARDVKGTDENIIAIIGDGSLSGGEAPKNVFLMIAPQLHPTQKLVNFVPLSFSRLMRCPFSSLIAISLSFKLIFTAW